MMLVSMFSSSINKKILNNGLGWMGWGKGAGGLGNIVKRCGDNVQKEGKGWAL